MRYSQVKRGYGNLFNKARIDPEHRRELNGIVERILKYRFQYEQIAATVKCPWYFIACIHIRESSGSFNRHFHNGDPLTARTVRVPAGRPPSGNAPFTFVESAIDALLYKRIDRIESWEIERVLYELERYNGFGYFGRGVNSPYLWSFTNLYVNGKYVADGKFSATAVDQQPGCVAIILMLIEQGIVKLESEVDYMQELQAKLSSFENIAPLLIQTLGGSSPLVAVKALAEVLGITDNKPESVSEKVEQISLMDLTRALGTAEQVISALIKKPDEPVREMPPEPPAGPLDNLLGGEKFKGTKTIIGAAIFVAAAIAEILFPGSATATIAIAKWLGGFLAGAGVVAKIERWILDFRNTIATQK